MGKKRGVPTPERHSTKTVIASLLPKHDLERGHDNVFKNVCLYDGVLKSYFWYFSKKYAHKLLDAPILVLATVHL